MRMALRMYLLVVVITIFGGLLASQLVDAACPPGNNIDAAQDVFWPGCSQPDVKIRINNHAPGVKVTIQDFDCAGIDVMTPVTGGGLIEIRNSTLRDRSVLKFPFQSSSLLIKDVVFQFKDSSEKQGIFFTSEALLQDSSITVENVEVRDIEADDGPPPLEILRVHGPTRTNITLNRVVLKHGGNLTHPSLLRIHGVGDTVSEDLRVEMRNCELDVNLTDVAHLIFVRHMNTRNAFVHVEDSTAVFQHHSSPKGQTTYGMVHFMGYDHVKPTVIIERCFVKGDVTISNSGIPRATVFTFGNAVEGAVFRLHSIRHELRHLGRKRLPFMDFEGTSKATMFKNMDVHFKNITAITSIERGYSLYHQLSESTDGSKFLFEDITLLTDNAAEETTVLRAHSGAWKNTEITMRNIFMNGTKHGTELDDGGALQGTGEFMWGSWQNVTWRQTDTVVSSYEGRGKYLNLLMNVPWVTQALYIGKEAVVQDSTIEINRTRIAGVAFISGVLVLNQTRCVDTRIGIADVTFADAVGKLGGTVFTGMLGNVTNTDILVRDVRGNLHCQAHACAVAIFYDGFSFVDSNFTIRSLDAAISTSPHPLGWFVGPIFKLAFGNDMRSSATVLSLVVGAKMRNTRVTIVEADLSLRAHAFARAIDLENSEVVDSTITLGQSRITTEITEGSFAGEFAGVLAIRDNSTVEGTTFSIDDSHLRATSAHMPASAVDFGARDTASLSLSSSSVKFSGGSMTVSSSSTATLLALGRRARFFSFDVEFEAVQIVVEATDTLGSPPAVIRGNSTYAMVTEMTVTLRDADVTVTSAPRTAAYGVFLTHFYGVTRSFDIRLIHTNIVLNAPQDQAVFLSTAEVLKTSVSAAQSRIDARGSRAIALASEFVQEDQLEISFTDTTAYATPKFGPGVPGQFATLLRMPAATSRATAPSVKLATSNVTLHEFEDFVIVEQDGGNGLVANPNIAVSAYCTEIHVEKTEPREFTKVNAPELDSSDFNYKPCSTATLSGSSTPTLSLSRSETLNLWVPEPDVVETNTSTIPTTDFRDRGGFVWLEVAMKWLDVVDDNGKGKLNCKPVGESSKWEDEGREAALQQLRLEPSDAFAGVELTVTHIESEYIESGSTATGVLRVRVSVDNATLSSLLAITLERDVQASLVLNATHGKPLFPCTMPPSEHRLGLTFAAPPRMIPPKIWKGVETTAIVTTTVSSVAGANPAAMFYPARASAVAGLIRCKFSHGDELDPTDSPLALRFGSHYGGYYRGAVVGNLLFIGIWVVLAALLTAMFYFPFRQRRTLWYAMGLLHLPGVLVLPAALLQQGSTSASTALLFHPFDGSDAMLGIGGVAVNALVMVFLVWRTYFALWSKVVPRHDVAQLDQLSGAEKWIEWLMLSSDKWINDPAIPERSAGFKEHWQEFYTPHRKGCGWYMGVEMMVSTLVGFLTGIYREDWCDGVHVVLLLVLGAQALVSLLQRPYQAPFETGFHIVLSVLTFIAAVFGAVGEYTDIIWFLRAAETVAFLVTIISIIRMAFDLGFGLRWFYSRYKRRCERRRAKLLARGAKDWGEGRSSDDEDVNDGLLDAGATDGGVLKTEEQHSHDKSAEARVFAALDSFRQRVLGHNLLAEPQPSKTLTSSSDPSVRSQESLTANLLQDVPTPPIIEKAVVAGSEIDKVLMQPMPPFPKPKKTAKKTPAAAAAYRPPEPTTQSPMSNVPADGVQIFKVPILVDPTGALVVPEQRRIPAPAPRAPQQFGSHPMGMPSAAPQVSAHQPSVASGTGRPSARQVEPPDDEYHRNLRRLVYAICAKSGGKILVDIGSPMRM